MLNRVIKQKTLRFILTKPGGNEALLSERILTGRTFSALPYSRLVNLSLHVVSVKRTFQVTTQKVLCWLLLRH